MRGGRWLVRMSDLGRGIHREGGGPPQLFTERLAFVGRLPGLAREGREFPWGWLQRLLERVIRSLEESADLFWLANTPPSAGAEYLAAHMTSVGVLTMQIGRGLGY